jgi:hypothetical protein
MISAALAHAFAMPLHAYEHWLSNLNISLKLNSIHDSNIRHIETLGVAREPGEEQASA